MIPPYKRLTETNPPKVYAYKVEKDFLVPFT